MFSYFLPSGSLFILICILNNLINHNEARLLTKQDMMDRVANVSSAEDTLIFAHILFRHGDRTPTTISTYKDDPNKYASYWPMGIEELNKNGMIGAYNLGLVLRQRYNHFLGPRYFPDLVGALSSPKVRCQTTLQCVLASLFPPTKDDLFLSDLPWRPIQYDIIALDGDDTFAVNECDGFFNLTSEFTNRTILDMIPVLEANTGEKIRNVSALFSIRDALEVARKVGKAPPAWARAVYPEPLNSAADAFFDAIIAQRLRLGAAGLYRRIVEDIRNKLDGSLSPPCRKMMLYAGHETNVVFALGAVEGYPGQVPKMASYVAIELHHINGTYGIKMFYENYDGTHPMPIDILKQGHFCPLDVFLRGTRWLIEDPKPFCKNGMK